MLIQNGKIYRKTGFPGSRLDRGSGMTQIAKVGDDDAGGAR